MASIRHFYSSFSSSSSSWDVVRDAAHIRQKKIKDNDKFQTKSLQLESSNHNLVYFLWRQARILALKPPSPHIMSIHSGSPNLFLHHFYLPYYIHGNRLDLSSRIDQGVTCIGQFLHRPQGFHFIKNHILRCLNSCL